MLPTQGLKTHVTEMLSLREMEHTLRVMGPQQPESSATRKLCIKACMCNARCKEGIPVPFVPRKAKELSPL